MDIEYNSTREKLHLAEYGRNVQKMVDYCMTIEDREKRNRVAKMIIHIMGMINPTVKENLDYKHKLWDHIYMISDYKLDVDSPYPPPTPEEVNRKPEKPAYAQRNIKYGHYGKNIEQIIKKASELEDGAEKEAYVEMIANHLKKTYLTWNRDSVNDEVIYENLDELSKGKLKLRDDAKLQLTNDILARNIKKKRHQRPGTNQSQKRRKK